MANYFTDIDEETKELIQECIKDTHPDIQLEYLINCLIPKYRQGMTVKEVFENELMAKIELDVKLNS